MRFLILVGLLEESGSNTSFPLVGGSSPPRSTILSLYINYLTVVSLTLYEGFLDPHKDIVHLHSEYPCQTGSNGLYCDNNPSIVSP